MAHYHLLGKHEDHHIEPFTNYWRKGIWLVGWHCITKCVNHETEVSKSTINRYFKKIWSQWSDIGL